MLQGEYHQSDIFSTEENEEDKSLEFYENDSSPESNLGNGQSQYLKLNEQKLIVDTILKCIGSDID